MNRRDKKKRDEKRVDAISPGDFSLTISGRRASFERRLLQISNRVKFPALATNEDKIFKYRYIERLLL